MSLPKCGCYKFNKITCNKNSVIFVKNKPYCYNHFLLLYNNYVITIQKYYRGYKTRKYLTNIFKKLPNDLQEIILGYINYNHYIKTYNNTISNIIIKNTYNLHNYENSDKKLSIYYLYNCYKLYTKYHSIISIKYLKHAYILSEQLLNFCNILIYQNQVILTYSYSIFEKIDITNIEILDVLNLINMIYKFSNIYSSIYQLYYQY